MSEALKLNSIWPYREVRGQRQEAYSDYKETREREELKERVREQAGQSSSYKESIAIIRNHVTDHHLSVLTNTLIFHDLNRSNYH